MNILRNMAIGMRNLFLTKQAEQELDDEVRDYVAHLVSEKMRKGMTLEQAMRAARLETGSIEAVKENVRAVEWEQALTTFWHDVVYGLRMMRKSPGFTTVAVLTLALGIGANSAMFGIVYGVLYRPLPFPEEHRIASVHMSFSPQNSPHGNLSLADFVDWKNENTAFEKVAAYSPSRFALTGGGKAEEVAGAIVTADYFSILGMNPILGRTFRPGDDSAGAEKLVVISTSLWQRRFGRSRDVVGRIIEMNGNLATIVGAVSDGFGFPRAQMELWQNLPLRVTRRGPFFFQGIGRLQPGVALQQAQAETNLIGHNIEQANPGVYANLTMPIEPLRNFLVGDLRPALLLMFAAVFAVLLIATVNIANLLLARASTRQREMAVRLSLGATRRRLVRQLLTESVSLSLVGAGVGWLLALVGIRLFRAFNPAEVPLAYQAQLGWAVLIFTVAVAVIIGALFGLVPAVQSARGDLHAPLKDGGRGGSAGAESHRLRDTLVIAEIALSFVLLVAAGLFLRSLVLLKNVEVGTTARPSDVLTMVVTPKALRKGQNSFQSEIEVIRFYQRVMDNVSRLPGVKDVAISDSLPPDLEGEDDTFRIAGRPWSDQAFPSTTLPKISPDYFRVLGVPLLKGRFFSTDDTADSQPVTIISESLANHYFPGTDPIGQKIGASGPGNTDSYMDIVGVVGDLKYMGMESEFKPAYYRPYTQNFNSTIFLLLRSAQPAASLAPMIEREIHSVDRDAVVRRVLTLQDLLSESVAQPRFRTMLITSFGVLALLLAAVGIYGVIAYSVTQRTQEIGIRMALGAQRSDVLRMVVRNGALLAAAGIAIGLLGSFATARAISRFLFATSANDPFTLTVGSVLLLAVALTATLIPAVRATRIDPQLALRHE